MTSSVFSGNKQDYYLELLPQVEAVIKLYLAYIADKRSPKDAYERTLKVLGEIQNGK